MLLFTRNILQLPFFSIVVFAYATMMQSCSQALHLKDVTVINRLFSPDGAHVVFTYIVDQGAMGDGTIQTSIVKVSDTIGVINKWRLDCLNSSMPACYRPTRWLSNDTLEVLLNTRTFIREGIPFDSTAFSVNGIMCKVIPFDISDTVPPLIEFFQVAQDQSHIVVGYSYENDLNISVVAFGEKLPKIGNISTTLPALMHPVRFARWKGDEIELVIRAEDILAVSGIDKYVNKNVKFAVDWIDLNDLDPPP